MDYLDDYDNSNIFDFSNFESYFGDVEELLNDPDIYENEYGEAGGESKTVNISLLITYGFILALGIVILFHSILSTSGYFRFLYTCKTVALLITCFLMVLVEAFLNSGMSPLDWPPCTIEN